MKPFLQRIAEEITTRYGDDTGSLCVVLPNRRAGMYLKKYLSAEMQKTIWAPQVYSIEDFISGISGCTIIDPTGLIFELYAVHREIKRDEAQDFELFADWGQVLLRDFDEIDRYLADPDKIFTFLNEARALSVWNLGESPLTDHETDYIRFYQSFRSYYLKLREKLLSKKQVYQGLAYRIAAENIEQYSRQFSWKKIFFAGLNALSTAEEKVIDHLVRSGMAEVFWDADEYYIRDEGQEAGEFIRKHLQKWPANPVMWLEREFKDSEKTIRVFGIPKGTGQAVKAGQIIREISKGEDAPDKTALVLADETLLLPVLYSLPEELGEVNVTMGFPFRYTNLYQLVFLVFQLQENSARYSAGNGNGKVIFYVKDILKVLSHPYVYLWLDMDAGKDEPDLISDLIRKKNRVFLRPGEIETIGTELSPEYSAFLRMIFSLWTSPGDALGRLLEILELIRGQMQQRMQEKKADHQLDFEYLYHLSRVIRRCRGLLEDYPFIHNINALRKIIFQILDINRLPFYGEPLKGLQVMGMLETRAIDFENLVVLSVNEGILPSGRTANSFIPFDIKTAFGLPTFQQKDVVFAYHFYRMIQRAKNIYLLYDTEGDQMKGGEKSRFITQISYELPKYNARIKITESLLSPHPPRTGAGMDITMPKTERVMEILKARAESGFSPTSINLYIRCPLQFYFQEVMGITESETVEETIEARTMGTAIHEALYRVYQPFDGKFVTASELAEKSKEAEGFLKDAFSEHYKEGDLGHGKNHLIFKVSLFMVRQFIQSEIDRLNREENHSGTLKIVHLEKLLRTELVCKGDGEKLTVRIKGKADRIDQWGGITRVIDYKTGLVRQDEVQVKSWDLLSKDPKMAKAFQLLVYAFLYYKNFPAEDGKLQSGNISFRKISEGLIRVKLPEGQEIGRESMAIFEEELTGVLEEIFDPQIPFNQTPEMEHCTYCPFRPVCTR